MSTEPDPTRCPLCGELNKCQQATRTGCERPCWCFAVTIPPELLEKVPAHLRNVACVCQKCVERFHAENTPEAPPAPGPGDYYMENGLMVFTAAYLLARGYCCGNGCRHCPYPTNPAITSGFGAMP
jgi:hypothetical protein